MQYKMICKVIGLLLMLFSACYLPPMAVAAMYRDAVWSLFLLASVFTFLAGVLLFVPTRSCRQELQTRSGFLVVFLFWVVLSFFAAIPFYFTPHLHLGWVNAWFEAVSGFTTTGSTILQDLDHLPHSMLFYRQELQYLGGMGIVVLAVAVLPMLGIGGMQLYRAEVPGPVKEYKMTPRLTETAKSLWYIYLILTLLCLMAYWLAGMDFFDAVCEAFSTVATGGFAVHDEGFAYYQNYRVELVGSCFMFLSALNFGSHFLMVKRLSIKHYLADSECRLFVAILLIAVALIVAILHAVEKYSITPSVISDVLFTVVSMATTTGLTSVDFSVWPTFLPFFVLLLGVIGGCAGSTTGGIKVVRFLLLRRQGVREIMRLIHPRGVFVVKLGGRRLSEEVVQSIWGFLSVFFMVYMALIIALLATGLDFMTAVGAATSGISNVGASIGSVAHTYTALPDSSKLILIFAMFAGRLEVFTILVLFTPAFWRQ